MSREASPVQALQQQRLLLQLEYATEKESFRQLTEQIGVQRKVKRGDAWWPVKVGRSYYNSLNQLAVEVVRTTDTDVEHNFEYGKPVMFFTVDASIVNYGGMSKIYTADACISQLLCVILQDRRNNNRL